MGSWSTRTTWPAPRDKASKLRMPLPEKRSRQDLPAIPPCSQLNRVSLTLDGEGLTWASSANETLLPRQIPPIILRDEGLTVLVKVFIAPVQEMVMSNVADTVDEGKQGLLARFKQGLSKTRSGLTKNLGRLFLGAKTIDADLLEEIETLLITGYFGVEVTQEIIQDLTDRVSRKTLTDSLALRAVLRDLLIAIVEPVAQPLVLPADAEPAVVLMVGVNGSGKTTFINCISGTLRNDSGSVFFDGADISTLPAHQRIRKGIARSFQIPKPFPTMTVRENILIPLEFGSTKSKSEKA